MTQKGYTLMELSIVVSIIVILGMAILLAINPMTQIFKGYDSRRKADLAQIKTALENYYADHDCYPVFPLTDADGKPSYACGSDFLKPYLNSMPCDPNTKEPYVIYLNPTDSVCPQKYAVYAQIYSFFGNASAIRYCPNTISVFSPDINAGMLSFGCYADKPCSQNFGCVNGQCAPIEDYQTLPEYCPAHWCESDCGGAAQNNCSFSDNACTFEP